MDVFRSTPLTVNSHAGTWIVPRLVSRGTSPSSAPATRSGRHPLAGHSSSMRPVGLLNFAYALAAVTSGTTVAGRVPTNRADR